MKYRDDMPDADADALLAEVEALERAHADADAYAEARRLEWLASHPGEVDAETEWDAHADTLRAGLSRGAP